MLQLISSLFSLLSGMGVLLVGLGLLTSLLGVRAAMAGMSSSAIGLVMAAYFAGFIVGTYLCPLIIRRAGHIRAFTTFASVCAALALMYGLWIAPWLWGGLRFVNGIMMVGLYMTLESWLNTVAGNEQRGGLFAIYVALSYLAMSAGQFLLLIDAAHGFTPFAVASILFSLGLVPIALTRVPQPSPVDTPALHLRQLIHQSPLATVGTFTSGVTTGAFWGLGAVFAKELGLSTLQIAAFMGVTVAGVASLQWPIGKLSDRFDRRRVLLGACAVGAALAAGISLAVHLPLPVLLTFSFFYGGVAFTLYGLSVAHMNDQIRVEDMLEASKGLLLMYGIGAVIGPVLGGVLMGRFGPASLFLLFGTSLLALALFGVYRSRVRPPVPPQEQGEYVLLVRTSQAALELAHPEAVQADEPQEEHKASS